MEMKHNKSLLPTAYVAGAPSASVEFKRIRNFNEGIVF